eukprot:6456928-Amphidinium_carterae.1
MCEQPAGSRLWHLDPWPRVLAHKDTSMVRLDQCRLGQAVNGIPAKKPTVLVSNCPEILFQFEGQTCHGHHSHHADLSGGRCSSCQIWPWAMCRRILAGIAQLKKRQARGASYAFPTSAAGSSSSASAAHPPAGPPPPAPPGLSRADQYAQSTCPACRGRQSKYDPRHSRIPGDCLHPDVVTELRCPGCLAGKPRWHELHSLVPSECRWAIAAVRRAVEQHTRRRHDVPRPALPRAHEEPTARIAEPHRLGDADEAAAQEEELRARDALEEEHEQGVLADPQHPEARAGRGPDREPRERRTTAEQGTTTIVGADWSRFDKHSSLRGLRLSSEGGKRRILRKLHLRWWHASAAAMHRILKAAGLQKDVLDMIPSVCETCTTCREWSRPSAEAIPSVRLASSFNHEVEADLLFLTTRDGTQHTVLHLVDRAI